MKNIKIKYNHPSYPPKNIDMNLIYSLDQDDGGYYIKNNDFKMYMSIDKIKLLFKLIDNMSSWDNILKPKKEKKEILEENNELSENDKHEIENLKHFQKNMKKKFKNKEKQNS